jgi:hypothetical protein
LRSYNLAVKDIDFSFPDVNAVSLLSKSISKDQSVPEFPTGPNVNSF